MLWSKTKCRWRKEDVLSIKLTLGILNRFTETTSPKGRWWSLAAVNYVDTNTLRLEPA